MGFAALADAVADEASRRRLVDSPFSSRIRTVSAVFVSTSRRFRLLRKRTCCVHAGAAFELPGAAFDRCPGRTFSDDWGYWNYTEPMQRPPLTFC